jgi:hypothetical protein
LITALPALPFFCGWYCWCCFWIIFQQWESIKSNDHACLWLLEWQHTRQGSFWIQFLDVLVIFGVFFFSFLSVCFFRDSGFNFPACVKLCLQTVQLFSQKK